VNILCCFVPDKKQGGYTVKVPALPVTQGGTVDEARAMARDVIVLYLEDLVADGKPIPTETVPPQLAKVTVRSEPPTNTTAQMTLSMSAAVLEDLTQQDASRKPHRR
jgi:predicted RNase H-like HicB family nuclease